MIDIIHHAVPIVNGKPDVEFLIKEYGDSLLRMCLLYMNDYYLAEDAVQVTYLKVWKKWDTYNGDSSLKTWLTSIAINTCRSMLRTNWYKNLLFHNDINNISYDADFEHVSDDTVIKTISQLPCKYKQVVILFYYQELKISEVAQVLRITEDTVSVRLNRARKQLKNKLKGWYFNE